MKPYQFILLLLFTVTGISATAQKKLTYGETSNGVYTNKFFGLKLQFNKDWHVKSREELEALTNQGKQLIKAKNEELGDLLDLSDATSAYFLCISKYKTGAPVEFNPSMILLSENLKYTPGITAGSDYLFNVKKLLKQTNMGYTFPESEGAKLNGFDVLEATLTYAGTTMTQVYFSKVINGYSLCCIASYQTEEEKTELLSFVNSITTD